MKLSPTSAAWLLSLLTMGCHPSDDTSGSDTRETAEPSIADRLVPPEGHWAADSFTVEPGRGLEWERDRDFVLEHFTVPHLYVRPDGTYVMIATKQFQETHRWALTSEDGLTWTEADEALIPGDGWDQDCGNFLADADAVYRQDGSLIMLVEGTDAVAGEDGSPPTWHRWCWATSDDGEHFQQQPGYIFEGGETDDNLPSVPDSLVLSDWEALVYYAGDLYRNYGTTEGESIRIASIEADATELNTVVNTGVLEGERVDPCPVYVEGGGVRLYYTTKPRKVISSSESQDGVTFTDERDLLAPDTASCNFNVIGECLLDPAYLRLADGTMVMYFTWWSVVAENVFTFNIGRAFAVD